MGLLKLGSDGIEVAKLQAKLNRLGYKLTADGDFGKLTHSAVLLFQKKNGLVADGICGAKTLAKIDELIKKLNIPKTTPKPVVTPIPQIVLPPVREALLTNHNRSKKLLSALKGVVIHWTANTGKSADAEANRKYFNNTDRSCSAHYIVDDHEIVHCIPDNEVAWHVGASKYNQIAYDKFAGYPNRFLIGIEMCVNSDGDWNKTYKHTVNLVANLLKKYKLTINDLYRHYDITGKICPKMFVDNPDAWTKFKKDVSTLL